MLKGNTSHPRVSWPLGEVVYINSHEAQTKLGVRRAM